MSTNNKNFKNFKLSNFNYEIVKPVTSKHFTDVRCRFNCDGHKVDLYVCYPKDIYEFDNKEEYISKAQEYIKTITDNGEIYDYCYHYINKTPYKLKTPFNFESFSFISKKKRVYLASDPKNKPKGPGKNIALVATSLVAVTGVALAVYFYLNRGKDTPTPVPSDEITITYNAGDGHFDEDLKNHAKTYTIKKNTTWADVAEKPTPLLDGNKFNYWTIDNKEIPSDYVFNQSTTIFADYTTDLLKITVDPAGGRFKDNTGDPKVIDNIKYGTTWGQILKDHSDLEIIQGPDSSYKFNSFRLDNEALNSESKIIKNNITITASYEVKDSTVITFSPGAGKFNDGGAFTVIFDKGVTWGVAKNQVSGKNPTLEGHTFSNYTHGTTVLTDFYIFNDKTAVVTANYTAQEFTITAEGNGGTFDNDEEQKEIKASYGTKWETLKNQFTIKTLPEHKTGLFKFKIKDSTSYVEDQTLITGDMSIVATYVEEEQYVLTVDANGGKLDSGYSAKTETVYKDDTWSNHKPSTNPSWTGKTFKFWTLDGETEVEGGHKIETNEKIYAIYEDTTVTVTINPNGCAFKDGTTAAKTKAVEYGKKWEDVYTTDYDILETSYPTDQTFDIYRVNNASGVVATNYSFVTDTTVYASFKTKDNITLTLDADGGKFKDDSSSAKSISIITGQTWGTVKSSVLSYELTKPGYSFKHYYLDKGNPTVAIPDSHVFASSTKIYAYYEIAKFNIHISTDTTKGTFTDTTVEQNPEVTYGQTWEDINTYTEGTGYKYRITNQTGFTFVCFKYKLTSTGTADIFLDTKHEFKEETWIEAFFINSDTKTVVVDPNGGTFNDDKTTAKFAEELTFAAGSQWSAVKSEVVNKVGSIDIKTPPAGYELDNYKYKDSTGTLKVLDDTTPISGSIVVTATYTPTKKTITLNSKNGGKFTGGVTSKTLTPNYGDYYVDSRPEIIESGYEFAYYVLTGTSTIIDTTHKYLEDETLDAKYYVTLTLNAGEGSLPGANTIKVLQGTKWKDIKDSIDDPTSKTTDYTFTYYSIDTGGTPIVIDDDYEFTAPVKFDANYSLNKPTGSNCFATDSWDKFSKIVSNGYDFISGKDYANGGYKEDFDTNGGTFVGLTRKIKLTGDDTEYTVRVIGQNVDTKSGGTNKAALTFEFVDTISTSEYSLTEGYVPWSDSTLRNKLQKELFNLMPSALLDNTNGIKSVDKSSYNTSSKTTSTSSDKLFVLSASELGFSKYPDYDTDVKSEGSKYAYYSDSREPARIKKDKLYWLRSADLLINGFTWAIDKDGNLGIENTSTKLHESRSNDMAAGVAPCFAI